MISEEIWAIRSFRPDEKTSRDSLKDSHVFQSRDTMAKDAFSPLGGGGGYLNWGNGA